MSAPGADRAARGLWRISAATNDVHAVRHRRVERRIVWKYAYRTTGRLIRRLFC